MKILNINIIIILVFFSNFTQANINKNNSKSSDVLVYVNNTPITRYDVKNRGKINTFIEKTNLKKMPLINIIYAIDKQVIDQLITEELSQQYINLNVTTIKEKTDEFIVKLEQTLNLNKGDLLKYELVKNNIDKDSFYKFIKSIIIQSNIISSLLSDITITEEELINEISSIDEADFNIEAWIFSSKAISNTILKKMKNFQKYLLKNPDPNCSPIKDTLYKDFAISQYIKSKILNLDKITSSVLLDTKKYSPSNIYIDEDSFKLVFLCQKDPIISVSSSNYIKNILQEKELVQKYNGFIKNLKNNAQIDFVKNN